MSEGFVGKCKTYLLSEAQDLFQLLPSCARSEVVMIDLYRLTRLFVSNADYLRAPSSVSGRNRSGFHSVSLAAEVASIFT